MESTARKSLYIRGLQAAHSSVLEVIDDSFHVAVYRFFVDKSRWEKMEIEGSAYVTRNSSNPFYSLIVLNKKGPSDLVLHVEENIEKIHIQEQYIMLRCNREEEKVTLGIWIHDTADRDRFYNSILRTKTIRKNSPDMSFLLGKFVQRAKSTSSLSEIESFPFSKVTVLVPATSALTASIKTSESNSSLAEKQENKSSALLSLLKSASKKDETGSISGNVSVDEIIEMPVKATVSSKDASNKLLSLLNAHKASSDSSTAFLTDGEISAKAKKRQGGNSSFISTSAPVSPTFKSLSADSSKNNSISKPVAIEQGVAALKAVLSIGSFSASFSPSRDGSEGSLDGSVLVPSSSNRASPTFSLPPAKVSTSPVTVTVSSLQESSVLMSPTRLFKDNSSFFATASSQTPLRVAAPMAGTSTSTKKAVKLISPADLGEVF